MKKNHAETVNKEYRRFKFPGFGSPGTCFLRARVRSSGLVILCSQLLEYHSTSVTNAVEQIFEAAIEQLQKDVGLDHLVAAKPWWRFRVDDSEFVEQVARRTIWVEHYPLGAERAPDGSFALVAFDSRLHPIWNYVSKDVAAAECGVDAEFLEINTDLLHYGT